MGGTHHPDESSGEASGRGGESIYDRRMNSIEQALKIAEQHNISRSATDVPAEELPDSEMFLLGRPMLQARLENLQAVGPAFDLDYDQNRAMLNTLNVGPTLDPRFRPIAICVRRKNR